MIALETPKGGIKDGDFKVCDHKGHLNAYSGGYFCHRCCMDWDRNGRLTPESHVLYLRRESWALEGQTCLERVFSWASLFTLGGG